MNVDGKPYRTIWMEPHDPRVVKIIDQRFLPHRFAVEDLRTLEETAAAIRDMHVRGAGLIGATAAYGMYLAALRASEEPRGRFLDRLEEAAEALRATRPTAVNLEWAVSRVLQAVRDAPADREPMHHTPVDRSPAKRVPADRSPTTRRAVERALAAASAIAEEDARHCRRIGEHGLPLLEELAGAKEGPVNVLTHCNAGWLAFVDYGSATAPIYLAHDRGVPVHVWVDETRPRNQGARLTAWELGQHGVPHTVIADNTGGHLMQKGMVDIVVTGADRVTCAGDAANKIGTYLKALAAKDNGVPFYVALPSSTFDWEKRDGLSEIPIEERDPSEVLTISGLCGDQIRRVRLAPRESGAANYAFDVTPALLITGLITERGVCPASEEGIGALFPEKLVPGPHVRR